MGQKQPSGWILTLLGGVIPVLLQEGVSGEWWAAGLELGSGDEREVQPDRV